MKTETPTAPNARLASLDILRGLDLFLLVFLQPVLIALLARLQMPWADALLYQLDHEVWEGFRFWDLIMPLFLFMAGAAMPFSMDKCRAQGAGWPVYRRILRRVLLLWLFGMLVQGNLLWFSPEHFRFYSNTLQAIAMGYLIAALVQLRVGQKGQMLAVAALMVAYSVPMLVTGDFSQDSNFAMQVDRMVLGRFRDGTNYTWVWSSLNFGATVLLGALAGRMMKQAGDKRSRVALTMAVAGVALVAAGLLWGEVEPIIKRLWTSSMTLYSGGLCFLLMAAFYYVIDVRGCRRGWGWLRIYGMNSIVAYMLGEVVNFRSIPLSLCYGMEGWMGVYYPVFITFCNFLILFFILHALYRARIFLKV